MMLSKDNIIVISGAGNVISLMMRNLGVRGHKLLWQENELKLALKKGAIFFKCRATQFSGMVSEGGGVNAK
jgi:hypothetical protein